VLEIIKIRAIIYKIKRKKIKRRNINKKELEKRN
jgi:hypothetical protein